MSEIIKICRNSYNSVINGFSNIWFGGISFVNTIDEISSGFETALFNPDTQVQWQVFVFSTTLKGKDFISAWTVGSLNFIPISLEKCKLFQLWPWCDFCRLQLKCDVCKSNIWGSCSNAVITVFLRYVTIQRNYKCVLNQFQSQP